MLDCVGNNDSGTISSGSNDGGDENKFNISPRKELIHEKSAVSGNNIKTH